MSNFDPLPPYSYVPGGPWPHPTSSPHGHSFGHVASQAVSASESSGAIPPRFLRGVALFNAGYYWEAHEVWEGLWHAYGRRGVLADVVKALIKLAAAGVKVREGQVARSARSCSPRWRFIRVGAERGGDSCSRVGPRRVGRTLPIGRGITAARSWACRLPCRSGLCISARGRCRLNWDSRADTRSHLGKAKGVSWCRSSGPRSAR